MSDYEATGRLAMARINLLRAAEATFSALGCADENERETHRKAAIQHYENAGNDLGLGPALCVPVDTVVSELLVPGWVYRAQPCESTGAAAYRLQRGHGVAVTRLRSGGDENSATAYDRLPADSEPTSGEAA